jgi:hypothetical protein
LLALELALQADPRSCGEPHLTYPGNAEMWVAYIPAIATAPSVRVLYQVVGEDEGYVTLWSISLGKDD